MIKIGCCGLSVSQNRYAAVLKTVEINSTFYQLPRLETAEKWRRIMPADFQFTVKAWQLITHTASNPGYRRLSKPIPDSKKNNYGHFRPTPEVQEAWKKTLEIAQALRAPLILLQTPKAFGPTPDNVANLRRFLRWAPRGPIRLAWEPRGQWSLNLLAQLCKDHQLVHAVDPLHSKWVPTALNYFRLHGISPKKRHENIEIADIVRRVLHELFHGTADRAHIHLGYVRGKEVSDANAEVDAERKHHQKAR